MSDAQNEAARELEIPEHLVPKDKKWMWVRYAVKSPVGIEYDILDHDTIRINAQRGYRPLWASECPDLHTEAKKKNSLLFLQYGGYILCQKDDPQPQPAWWVEALEWLKNKIDEFASWLKAKIEEIAIKLYEGAKAFAIKIYDWVKGWFNA